MRSLPPNSVFHNRGDLKRRSILAIAAVSLLAGCAKFPSNPAANSNVTKVIIRVQVAGTINPNYVYDVAIRSSADPNPTTDQAKVPSPTLDSSSPNGRMAGSPTHFVEFNALTSQIEPFSLYRFATAAEIPNPTDPSNLINLAHWTQVTDQRIVTFEPVTPGSSNTLAFTLYINQIPDTLNSNANPQALQLNFLTMNRLSNQGAGNRVIDSLGDNRSPGGPNQFIKIDLRSNLTYGNAGGLPGSDLEPTGDCADPDLDIVGWTVEVQRP
ncbi:hypothetical protein [Fimbriimonas ginsengisoli]|uniref:Lipoprotein n=1 Tax=Fimbriimonas ginsengisoli Gsoil 348 TaxID=661478 RepID=A0A068NKW7_FIMGI|nr:hypothetical protein [Fimbriimonas ginsengisoli]AIE84116.1 hypothetical protein OP10G_0748 [Fimbriimonas ginsengisoli Gsoil 348]